MLRPRLRPLLLVCALQEKLSVTVLVASEYLVHTLLCQSLLLVLLESRIAVLPLNGGIRSRLCEVQVHLAPEQVEAL